MIQRLRGRASQITWQPWAFLFLVILGLASLVLFNRWLTVRFTQPWSFAVPWAGLRAWLFQGQSPYSVAAVRILLRPWLEGAIPPDLLPVPFFALWFYFPLALIPDGPTAYALWLTLQQVLVALWVASLVRMIPVRGWAWALFLLLSLLWPGTWVAWQEGRPTVLIVATLGLAWSAVMEGRDTQAGLLFLPTLLDLPVFGWVLVAWGMWSLGRGRRDGPVTWGTVALGAGALMTWLQPKWWEGYFWALTTWSVEGYRGPGLLVEALSRTFPGLGARVGLAAVSVAFLWMLVQWGRAWIGSAWTAYWTWHWTLALLPWFAWRKGEDVMLLLLPALLLTLSVWWYRWRFGLQVGALIVVLFWGGLWALYFQVAPEDFLNLTLLTTVPFSLLLLSWVRWWFTRPEPWWSTEAFPWA